MSAARWKPCAGPQRRASARAARRSRPPPRGALTGALGKLFALSEAYPDLKANANFQQLQSDLSDIENKLGCRTALLQQRRQRVQRGAPVVPGRLFAQNMGFAQREFFDVGETSRQQLDQAPSVKF